MSESSKNTTQLTTDLIGNPSIHRLGLLITPRAIDVIIRSRFSDSGVIYRHIDFDSTLSPIAALKETVYDNPLLTAEFHATDILINTDKFFVVSAADATPNEIERRVALLWPDEPLSVITTPLAEGSTRAAVFVAAVDKELAGFLRRTFINPNIASRMGVFTRYFVMKNNMGNMGNIHVHIQPGRTDIVAVSHKGLLLANTFSTNCAEDAAYYTLAVAKHLDYDMSADRILVGGNRKLRDELITSLRRFVQLVMPEIMPAALNLPSSDFNSVPFELLAAPMCLGN